MLADAAGVQPILVRIPAIKISRNSSNKAAKSGLKKNRAGRRSRKTSETCTLQTVSFCPMVLRFLDFLDAPRVDDGSTPAGDPFFKEVDGMDFEQNLRFEDLPDYLTIKELRQYLRIGANKAYELANKPGFPCLRFGNKKIFPKAQVKEWLDKETERGKLPKKLRAILS